MSYIGFIRRKWFWHRNPLMYKDYVSTLDIIQNCTRENVDCVENRLESLLNHAATTTKYYEQIGGGRKLYDFPVINKNIIIDNRALMTSNRYFGEKLHIMRTSGSTGMPFEISQDSVKRRHVIAEIKATNEIVGYPSHEKMLYLLNDLSRDPRRSRYSKMQQFSENIYRRSVAINDEKTLQYLVDFISSKKTVAIHASGCNLRLLVDYILLHNISPKQFKIRTVITGGEMIPESLRIETEKAFGNGCKCVVKYSNEEMGILAIDNGLGTPYQLNVANYYFEILKLDSDEPVKNGEMGRIVVTDLFNYAVPMIRYDTGDLGVMEQTDGWPVLTKVEGKRRDLIYSPEGYPIAGSLMTHIMQEAKNIQMWQFIQENKNEYCLKIVPKNGCTPSENDINLSQIKGLLGSGAKIRYEFSNEIPTIDSQKRRYTVNLFNVNQ